MARLPQEIQRVSEMFSSFPGIGPKLSYRLGLFAAIKGKQNAQNLVDSINKMLRVITVCKECGNVASQNICDICNDPKRDKETIVVVEDSLDLYSIEDTKVYNGLYHVLQGVISPINGVTPDDLTISLLLQRVKSGNVKEVVFALNPTVEGDSTVLYIQKKIQEINSQIKTTRLAKGIPSGSDLEFIAPQTIAESLKRRDII
ncbi:MAG: recombination protein RecR [Candidatus Dojkabacteria bacterium]|nr:MAG: recombination protein RecR [Candidatus Dojkabacteria bacterium]